MSPRNEGDMGSKGNFGQRPARGWRALRSPGAPAHRASIGRGAPSKHSLQGRGCSRVGQEPKERATAVTQGLEWGLRRHPVGLGDPPLDRESPWGRRAGPCLQGTRPCGRSWPTRVPQRQHQTRPPAGRPRGRGRPAADPPSKQGRGSRAWAARPSHRVQASHALLPGRTVAPQARAALPAAAAAAPARSDSGWTAALTAGQQLDSGPTAPLTMAGLH